MLAVNDLASQVGMEAACRAFAFNPGYVYRCQLQQSYALPPANRPRALLSEFLADRFQLS
jgi:hypothetical protein